MNSSPARAAKASGCASCSNSAARDSPAWSRPVRARLPEVQARVRTRLNERVAELAA